MKKNTCASCGKIYLITKGTIKLRGNFCKPCNKRIIDNIENNPKKSYFWARK